MFKIVLFIVIIYLCYVVFVKKRQKITDNKPEKVENMIECKKCSTFVSIDDAIVKDGEYFCSKECLS